MPVRLFGHPCLTHQPFVYLRTRLLTCCLGVIVGPGFQLTTNSNLNLYWQPIYRTLLGPFLLYQDTNDPLGPFGI